MQGLEIQIGARTLLHPTNFHVAKGDKIGLVRAATVAGKTTLTRVITGDMLPTAGKSRLRQAFRLPAAGHARLRSHADRARPHDERARHRHHHQPHPQRPKGYDRPGSGRDEQRPLTRYRQGHYGTSTRLAGYAAQSEAISMAACSACRRVRSRSSSSARSRWPAPPHRAGAHPVLQCRHPDPRRADQPLDADSIEWLRGYLKKYEGGFLVISHSTELLDEVVNKVSHLDAQLGQIDMYSRLEGTTCTSA